MWWHQEEGPLRGQLYSDKGLRMEAPQWRCCCYSIAQSCPTLCHTMDCSMPGFPVLHYLPEFSQTHVVESVMPSNHPILCHPLLLQPSIFPASGSFILSWLFNGISALTRRGKGHPSFLSLLCEDTDRRQSGNGLCQGTKSASTLNLRLPTSRTTRIPIVQATGIW